MPQRSRRTLFIGIAAVFGLILIITIVSVVLFGGNRSSGPVAESNTSPETRAKQALTGAEDGLKRSASEQDTIKSALKDGDKQIKVSD